MEPLKDFSQIVSDYDPHKLLTVDQAIHNAINKFTNELARFDLESIEIEVRFAGSCIRLTFDKPKQ